MTKWLPQPALEAHPITFCEVGTKSDEPLGLVFLELLESSHHLCSGYLLRLSSVLDPSLYELFYKSLSGVDSGVLSLKKGVCPSVISYCLTQLLHYYLPLNIGLVGA